MRGPLSRVILVHRRRSHMFRAFIFSAALFAFVSLASAQDPATAPAYGYKDTYQVNVMGNLNFADSVVNITNAGVYSGGHAYICANVSVFDPNETMIACCTCPVSKDGVRSLSAQSDLINNTA